MSDIECKPIGGRVDKPAQEDLANPGGHAACVGAVTIVPATTFAITATTLVPSKGRCP
jgi:hypothetical protein